MSKNTKSQLNKIKPSQFDVSKFKLSREIIEKQPFKGVGKTDVKPIGGNQYTAFPKYVYSQTSGNNNSKVETVESTLGFLTDPIEIRRGGLLKIHDSFRPTDDDCTAFWLPLEKEFGGDGAVDLRKMLEKIDKHYEEKISSNSSNFLVIKNGKQEEPISNLSYVPLIKTAEAPDGAKDFVQWERTKVRIPFKEVDGKKEIDMKLIVPGDDGELEKKIATSITELRKDFTYGCKARFFLEIKTFWVLKSTKKINKTTLRDCGFKITCKMINIIEKSKINSNENYGFDDYLDDGESGETSEKKTPPKKKELNLDSDSDSEKKNKTNKNNNNIKKQSESESDSDSDSDSEPESKPEPKSKKTCKTKKNSNKKNRSDSDSDSESEPESKSKKTHRTKKNSNKKNRSDSDSDSDSD